MDGWAEVAPGILLEEEGPEWSLEGQQTSGRPGKGNGNGRASSRKPRPQASPTPSPIVQALLN